MDLRDRRILVTGASRGIGEQVARHAAAAGARVALVARSSGPLDALAAELGGTAYPADLADPDARAGLVERVEADGPVAVLVNNAGIDVPGAFTAMSADQLVSLVELDLLAPMELARGMLPRWLDRGEGHLVNVSSLAASVPWPGLAAYCGAKAGLSQFTEALRLELRGRPVGLTLVELGAVLTDLLAGNRRHGPTARAWRRATALRLSVDVTSEDVGRAVVAAVRSGRSHVRLPRRTAVAPALVGIPRRAARVMLAGVDLDRP